MTWGRYVQLKTLGYFITGQGETKKVFIWANFFKDFQTSILSTDVVSQNDCGPE